MSTTPRTVFTVTDKILQPLLDTVPRRPSVGNPDDAQAWLSPSFVRDRLRGLAIGVFDGQAEPWQVRFVGDAGGLTVFNGAGPPGSLFAAPLESALGFVFRTMPERPAGPGGPVLIEADERGVFEPEQECVLLDVMAVIERPRLGTVLVDLAIGATRCAEYPVGGFGFLDNDHGRYWFTLARDQAKRWQFCLGPGSREHAEAWVAEVVAEHA